MINEQQSFFCAKLKLEVCQSDVCFAEFSVNSDGAIETVLMRGIVYMDILSEMNNVHCHVVSAGSMPNFIQKCKWVRGLTSSMLTNAQVLLIKCDEGEFEVGCVVYDGFVELGVLSDVNSDDSYYKSARDFLNSITDDPSFVKTDEVGTQD